MKIFINNLADEVTENDLKKAFENFGQVTVVSIVRDSFGESRGTAFVDMPAEAEALTAIDGLNGHELKGRALNVNKAGPGQ